MKLCLQYCTSMRSWEELTLQTWEYPYTTRVWARDCDEYHACGDDPFSRLGGEALCPPTVSSTHYEGG